MNPTGFVTVILQTPFPKSVIGLSPGTPKVPPPARNIIVNDRGIYLGDGIFGGSNAHPMDDSDGDGIWSVTLQLPENQTGNYAFFNGPGDGGDWGTKENLTGLSCADPNNFNNRILSAVTADQTLSHCFGSCDAPCHCSIQVLPSI